MLFITLTLLQLDEITSDRAYTCSEDDDEKYNHNGQTRKVNVRKDMENISKDLDNKNDNIIWTFIFEAYIEGKYF